MGSCVIYTKAPITNLVGEKSCISFTATMDMTADDQAVPEDIIDTCDFSVGDTDCECNKCSGPNEIKLACPSLDFMTDGCMDVYSDVNLVEDQDGGDSSMLRFVPYESSAFGATPSIVSLSFFALTLARLF